jgi:imidazolonepropionase-like amidohydrolase
LASRKIPVILTADLGTEPSLAAPANANPADVAPEEVRKERSQRWQEQAGGASVLAQAGVELIFSSEGGVSDLLGNVRKRIQRGLPREAALLALTSRAAKLLGISDKTGSIEVGKRANLVLMSGDFAAEDSKVETVLVDGRVVAQPEAGK